MITQLLTRRSRVPRLVLYGVVVAVAAAALAVYRPTLLARLDDRAYDVLVRWARPKPASGRVQIVDVDERSLAGVGQWPWPRSVIGGFVERLRESGAAVIALDMVFAEPERAPSSSDGAFADLLRAGRSVIGYAFTFERQPRYDNPCVLHPLAMVLARPGDESTSAPLFSAADVICSQPDIARAVDASGFLNASPDSDGVLRRAPLLIAFNDRVYPSLALASVKLATHTGAVMLRVNNANSSSLVLGERVVPLDGKGNVLLNYRGKKRTFPFISAVDVMRNRVDREFLQDKVVFVGATALGTRDVVTTPLDTLFTGIELQATIADDMLQNDFLSRPALAPIVEGLLALVVGVTMIGAFRWLGSTWGGVAVIPCVVLVWGVALWALSTRGSFVSPLVPTLAGVTELGVLLLTGIAHERRRADRAMSERDVARDLMFQSLLSLAEIRDADTGRHSRRTRAYARLLMQQLSANPRFGSFLTPDRLDMVAKLVPLHDIGKVGIPDHLLNKPGQLTADEIAEMRKHPAYGRDAIVKAQQHAGVGDDDQLVIAKDIVYTHHEWWNGNGYPRGLRGEEIPIPGRVVALVDAYDALISGRVYREAIPHETAVSVIADAKGTHFDPAIVDAFLQVAPKFRSASVESVPVDLRSVAN